MLLQWDFWPFDFEFPPVLPLSHDGFVQIFLSKILVRHHLVVAATFHLQIEHNYTFWRVVKYQALCHWPLRKSIKMKEILFAFCSHKFFKQINELKLLTLNSLPKYITVSSPLLFCLPSSDIIWHNVNISSYTSIIAFMPLYSVKLPAFGFP